jgi:hypothetical protein
MGWASDHPRGAKLAPNILFYSIILVVAFSRDKKMVFQGTKKWCFKGQKNGFWDI